MQPRRRVIRGSEVGLEARHEDVHAAGEVVLVAGTPVGAEGAESQDRDPHADRLCNRLRTSGPEGEGENASSKRKKHFRNAQIGKSTQLLQRKMLQGKFAKFAAESASI